MKRKTKKIITILCLLFLATPLISCGKEESKAPEEVVKAYIGTYLKSKDVDFEKAGIDRDKVEEIANKRDYNLINMFDFTKETNEGDFLKALYSALSKVEYTIASSSIEDNTAKVAIGIKGINLDSIKNDSYKFMLEEKKKKVMKPDEREAVYINSVIDKLNNIKLDESKTIEIELNKASDNLWELTDDSLTKLESAITEKEAYTRSTDEVPDTFKGMIKQSS
ncbi:hypothetical protein NNC19_02590 [Clostridium sp. SHJSY1]|uniref:hypothetical protein n=1 Tax=Clostridium sp. SHJSY1 TaxID=2942483 RepID=UPI0028742752|nr:hypothetical protein [Clostridium sp. SHJSY1]MDS0524549.1 hypothetical protein [Clostridium sp. SHJSY1]